MKMPFLSILNEQGISAEHLTHLKVQTLAKAELKRIAMGIDPTPSGLRKILKALGLPLKLAKDCKVRRPAHVYRYYAERRFANRMRLLGYTMIPQPRAFTVGATSWTADFYCPELDCYYEVIGTHQALSQNKQKLQAVRAEHPRILIKIVDSCGVELHRPMARTQPNLIHTAAQVLMALGVKEHDLVPVFAEAVRLARQDNGRAEKGTGKTK